MMLERSNVWKYSKDTREKSQKRYSILKELRFYQLGSIMLRRYGTQSQAKYYKF